LEFLMLKTEFVMSMDGTRIAFDREGTGPPVVLVEPSGHYRELSAFEGLRSHLASHFSVYAYDRRGRGDSGDAREYEPEREVEDLGALIDLIAEPVRLYGYSSGALLALRAAACGLPIARMALLEPPLQEPGSGPDPLTGELSSLVAEGRYADAVEHFHRSIGVPDEYLDQMPASPTFHKMVRIAPTLVYDCQISDTMTPELLAKVSVPSLILVSAGSSHELTGWAADVAAVVPGATHDSLPGSWHTVGNEILAERLLEYFEMSPTAERRSLDWNAPKDRHS
jgi:pimeloyl-ACP methyl ester carboxylesterase